MSTNQLDAGMTSEHLADEAALRWQIGEATAAERAHVAQCATCQAQTHPLAESLQLFRTAAQEWGAVKAATTPRTHAPQHVRLSWSAIAAVCALLLLTISIAAVRWQSRQASLQMAARQRQVQQQMAQDDALLEAVDQDVSQIVPDALTPLARSSNGNTQQ